MNDFEDRYRTIVDAIPAMAWSGRPDGSVEFLNRRWLDYTGYSLDEALAWGWKAAVHPDDLDALTDRWRALLASGQAGEIEARLRRYDGEYRWFLFRADQAWIRKQLLTEFPESHVERQGMVWAFVAKSALDAPHHAFPFTFAASALKSTLFKILLFFCAHAQRSATASANFVPTGVRV